MAEEIENANSQNGEETQEPTEEELLNPEGEEETDDPEVLKERLGKRNSSNAQLYARLKKAQGFEQKDGKWVKKAAPANASKPAVAKKGPEIDIAAEIQRGVSSELEKRDLESLEHSDELKTEIQNLARLKGISVKKAEEDPYIKFRIEQEAKKANPERGSIPRGGKAPSSVADDDDLKAYDPRTEEGQKAIAARNKRLREKLG
jgi:hypothetical protein